MNEPDEVPRNRPSISAVIISCNEAEVIEACIESVATWVDEIVVVDMHSTDGTRDIVRRYTQRLVDHERLPYVEPARNFALAQATGDWLIMLDPDERVPTRLAITLTDIARKNDFDVVIVPRLTRVFGVALIASGFQRDAAVRFFRSGLIDWPGHVHGQPALTGLRVLELRREHDLQLIHETWNSIEAAIDRIRRYGPGEADLLAARRANFSVGSPVTAGVRAIFVTLVRNQGYKDGVVGVWMALLMGMYHTTIQLMLWERLGKPHTADRSIKMLVTIFKYFVYPIKLGVQMARVLKRCLSLRRRS